MKKTVVIGLAVVVFAAVVAGELVVSKPPG